MNYCIYVIRHQKPHDTLNCVHKDDIYNTENIAKHFKNLYIGEVYTVRPTGNEQILPLQTASNISSMINLNVTLCYDFTDLPKFVTNNILIVWPHHDIQNILHRYKFVGSFYWPDENYNGCLTINAYGWDWDPLALNKSYSCF